MILDYYDGRIPMEMSENIETTVRKISEAYCVHYNLPVSRKFTDAELEDALIKVREAIALQQPLELTDYSPHVRIS